MHYVCIYSKARHPHLDLSKLNCKSKLVLWLFVIFRVISWIVTSACRQYDPRTYTKRHEKGLFLFSLDNLTVSGVDPDVPDGGGFGFSVDDDHAVMRRTIF